jgi:ribosomal protein L17
MIKLTYILLNYYFNYHYKAKKMNNNSDIDRYIESLLKCEYITEEEVKHLCDKAKEILINMDNLIHLSTPITVRNIFLI